MAEAKQTLSSTFTELIKTDVVQACAADGLMIKENTTWEHPGYQHAPMTLFPTPYPLDIYKSAYELQSHMGDLISAIVANPREHIHELLSSFATKDAFMARLIQVSKAVADQKDRGEPIQNIHFNILRSDYMIDQPTHSIKLVEYNTIASSFGCLSNKVREMHDYIAAKYADRLTLNYGVQDGDYKKHLRADASMADLPIHSDEHSYVDKLVDEFAQAISLYKGSRGVEAASAKPWVIFVCEDDERNLCDQKVVEVLLQRRHGISSMRKTMLQISAEGRIDPESKLLFVDEREIGFVYYRTGYQADHYMEGEDWDETKWQTREMMECSMAVKCPSIDLHLATFKKFQQSFSDEALLRQISGSDATTAALKQLFKGIWSLENLCKEGAEVNEVVERALENPQEFVLKPQKEGGGNNFFDEELKENLLRAKAANGKDQALSTYLIMERIHPPMIPALMLRNGEVTLQKSLSEFGFFSAVFSQNTDGQFTTIQNKVIGTLMRTKASHHNEGGVNAGFSVIDSPFLVPVDDFNTGSNELKGTVQL